MRGVPCPVHLGRPGLVAGLRDVDRQARNGVNRVGVAGPIPVSGGIKAVDHAVVVADNDDEFVLVDGGGVPCRRWSGHHIDLGDDGRGEDRRGGAFQPAGRLEAPDDAAGEAIYAVDRPGAVATRRNPNRVGHDDIRIRTGLRRPGAQGDSNNVTFVQRDRPGRQRHIPALCLAENKSTGGLVRQSYTVDSDGIWCIWNSGWQTLLLWQVDCDIILAAIGCGQRPGRRRAGPGADRCRSAVLVVGRGPGGVWDIPREATCGEPGIAVIHRRPR